MFLRSREQVRRALAHREPGRIPFNSLTEPEARTLVESMGLAPERRDLLLDGDFRHLTFKSSPDHSAYEPYLRGLPAGAAIGDWGVGELPLRTADGCPAGYRMFHPLAQVDTPEGIAAYPFPDLSSPWRHDGLERQVAAAKAAQFTVVGQMSQQILETAYSMRGIEQLMMDFYERPAFVEALFERLAEQRRFQARRFAQAGVDVLRIGDDIATQRGLLVGLRLYRERIKPFHASVIAAARQVNPAIRVLYHSDGNLTDLLPDLIEIGVTAINPVQAECMDLARTKREFGRRLVLWGCCAVQSTYARGSRQDVLDELRFLREEVAPGGGLVLQFTNLLMTPASLANLRVFFENYP